MAAAPWAPVGDFQSVTTSGLHTGSGGGSPRNLLSPIFLCSLLLLTE